MRVPSRIGRPDVLTRVAMMMFVMVVRVMPVANRRRMPMPEMSPFGPMVVGAKQQAATGQGKDKQHSQWPGEQTGH